MGIEFGPGQVFITTGNTLEKLGSISEIEFTREDTEPEMWPAVNPFLQLQKEATLTCKAFIDLRELLRLIYGRKRWRNKRKAIRMVNRKARRRAALREKLRRSKA